MNNQTSIEKLINSGKKVFTTDDLAVIWQIADRKKLNSRIKYYPRQQRLQRIHKGVYAIGGYSSLEVAQKLVPLSYVSLYTTAQMYGLTFQNYDTVFCVALKSKKYKIGDENYEYHKVKESIFYNPIGLVNDGNYTYANKERTICDLLYIYPNFAFDNLRSIDTVALKELATMYGNKLFLQRISKLIVQINKG